MGKHKIGILLFTILGCLFVGLFNITYAQTEISGTVTDAETDQPLPGVNIQVKGTTTGTASDSDGEYELTVESLQDTLRFSFVGYQIREVPISGQTTVNVELQSEAITGEEVVVTALGQEREEKSLTYSTQNISSDELAEAKPLNVVNSLSGRVSGISVNESSTGLGGDSRVVLRGNRSISGSSQPLYVVDGVPIQGGINGLNSNNIESINVLKGANAAALYGSEANNGVIIVTTKEGTGGELQVSVGEEFTLRDAAIQKNYQNQYGQGNSGKYSTGAEQNWGPKMDGSKVKGWSMVEDAKAKYAYTPQPDNVKEAFQQGYKSATNLSISTGNEDTQYFFSYEYTDAKGIVPNNQLSRNNVNLRVNSDFSEDFTLDAKLNYIRSNTDNKLNTGENFQNPLRHIWRLPRNIRTSQVENFEYITDDGQRKQNFWNPGSNGGANPYWTENRNLQSNLNERIVTFASLTYDITDNLNLMIRSALDRSNGNVENRTYNNTYITNPNGNYHKGFSNSFEWNSDFLFTYKNSFSEDLSVDISAGGNLKKERNNALNANTGDALTIRNFFALKNTQKVEATENIGAPRNVQSLYASGTVGFLDEAINLDLSARNDWSSTLPKGNRSYFYPSAGLNVILTDLIPSVPGWLSLAKVRGSYAEVGNDTSPFNLQRTANLSAGGRGGFVTLSSTIPNENLVPEKTKSLELGANLGFFNNRLGLDFTWYKTNSENQLFSVALPVGSGASNFFTNGGNVQNKGIEATLSATPVSTSNFSWDLKLNFSRNQSLVKKINDERPQLSVASDFLRDFKIEEGKPWGEVYSRGFERDEQGHVIVGSDGIPKVTDGMSVQVANYNPDWLGGISSNLNYKNISMSFLVNIRKGGTVASLTNAILFADGQTKATLKGRDQASGDDGGLVFGQDVFSDETAVKQTGTDADGKPVYGSASIETDAETFWNAMGGRNSPIGEAFVTEATNIRMQEITLGYTIPASTFSNVPIQSLKLSLVGRNLFFFYNASDNFDPSTFSSSGKAAAGFESFNMPNTRSYGLNIKLDF